MNPTQILLADDDRRVRDAASRALQAQYPDAIIIHVRDAVSAIQVMRTHRFDVIVTDLFLSGATASEVRSEHSGIGTGYHVAEAAGATPGQGPVYVVTSDDTIDEVPHASAVVHTQDPQWLDDLITKLDRPSETATPRSRVDKILLVQASLLLSVGLLLVL